MKELYASDSDTIKTFQPFNSALSNNESKQVLSMPVQAELNKREQNLLEIVLSYISAEDYERAKVPLALPL